MIKLLKDWRPSLKKKKAASKTSISLLQAALDM